MLSMKFFFDVFPAKSQFLTENFLSFQSGNESRSRAESLASNALDDGEFLDYKALYEAAK